MIAIGTKSYHLNLMYEYQKSCKHMFFILHVQEKGESLDPNFETTVIPTTQGQDRNQSNGLLIAAGQWKYRSTKRVREGRQLVVIFWERGTGLLNTSPGHHLFSSCFLFIYQFLLLFLEYQSVRFSLSINFSTPYFEYSVFLEIFCLYF